MITLANHGWHNLNLWMYTLAYRGWHNRNLQGKQRIVREVGLIIGHLDLVEHQK